MRVMILALLALMAAASGGLADEVCVVCSEPSVTYRCMSDPKMPQFKGSDKVLQYVCMTELAKSGHHATCKVSRDTAAGCLGLERVVTTQGVEIPAGAATIDPPPPTEASTKETPPKTLVEMAQRTKDKMDTDTKSAGEAVSGAMKKTWNCLTSLFFKC